MAEKRSLYKKDPLTAKPAPLTAPAKSSGKKVPAKKAKPKKKA